MRLDQFILISGTVLFLAGCSPKPIERAADVSIYATGQIFKSTEASTIDPVLAKFLRYYYVNRDGCVGYFAPNYYLGTFKDISREPHLIGSIVLDGESKGGVSETPKSDEVLRARALVQISKWKALPQELIAT